MLLPVTKRWDLMLGVDIHLNEWGIPTAHIVGATLNWVNNDRFSPDVFANNQPVAYFLHDIKMLIPHIPLGSNMLVPIIMLLSHSRILLAAHLVRVNFRAIGVGPWPMLNCNIVFPLPTGWLGSLDQGRRSLAHWLFNPRETTAGDRLRHRLARAVYYLDYFKILCATRDFRAFHNMLVEQGLAVWAGQPFRQGATELPDDVGKVVKRIRELF